MPRSTVPVAAEHQSMEMHGFYSRHRARVAQWGFLRTLGYYLSAAAEEMGIELSLAFEYVGHLAETPKDATSTFAVLVSMKDWSERDLELLQATFTSAQLQLFEKLFVRGDKCVIARSENSELACLCWIEATTEYMFGRGCRGFLIHACYTFPDYRGKGLYPHTLSYICSFLKAQAADARIFIQCSIFNHASKRGIIKAGFVPVGRIARVRKWKWGWPKTTATSASQIATDGRYLS